MRYVAIRSEGGLLPYELLDKIAAEDVPGQKASDFGLAKGRRLNDEITRVWSDAQDLWDIFKRRRESLSEKDPYGTTLTRDRWMLPLLSDVDMLGYDLKYQPTATTINRSSYPVSHRAGEGEDAPPVHIEGFRIDLDRRLNTKLRTSPQAMVQEYLNNSEAVLWAIVTNGVVFRILRDSSRTSRPQYIEFDLESIIEGNRYNEFALFYRLCHRTRFPIPDQDPSECLLEQYYQQSIDEGARVRERLRDGVEDALKILGTALVRHPANSALRDKAGNRDFWPQYHRQLLLLVYRLLFLMVAEERGLIVSIGDDAEQNQKIYDEWYSISRLRERASNIVEETPFGDLWIGLQRTFSLFEYGIDANPLGIPPLNGDLFDQTRAIPDLVGTQLYSHHLLLAVRRLSVFKDGRGGPWTRVNYSHLDVEELGSVYESLLDYQPVIQADDHGLSFELSPGMERKRTGSYYTRPELVQELIESALVPVMQERLAEAERQSEGKDLVFEQKTKEHALLSMSICDPACGSGHFLLAAARRLGKELARIRTGEDEPKPGEFHLAVRDVISHCIYGVDLNPLAVDLCKVALWLEGHWAGKPLSFLDHRIRCGNSLIGLLDAKVLEDGIPDDAFTAVEGDDKKVAAYLKKRNKLERTSRQRGFDFDVENHTGEYASTNRELREIPENTAADVRRKAEIYSGWRSGMQHWHDELAADLWTAQFFLPLTSNSETAVCTTKDFLEFALDNVKKPQLIGASEAASAEQCFFHWYLEFPEVLDQSGFDVMLGNPPFINIIDGRIPIRTKRFLTTRTDSLSGTADVAYHFLDHAHLLTRKGGRIGFVQPRSILNADSAALLRRKLMNERPPAFLHVPRTATFFEGAAAYVCLLVLASESGCMVSESDELLQPPKVCGVLDQENWWTSFERLITGLKTESYDSDMVPLSESFSVVGSMTTADAYLARDFVCDGNDIGQRLITTGLIDPFVCKWGDEPCRYLGRSFERPVLHEVPDMPATIVKRLRESRRPKILVAGLSNRIEAYVDSNGECCGAVSTFTIFHPRDSVEVLHELCKWLNGGAATDFVRSRLGAASVGGGYMTIKKSVLLELPVPANLDLQPKSEDQNVL